MLAALKILFFLFFLLLVSLIVYCENADVLFMSFYILRFGFFH